MFAFYQFYKGRMYCSVENIDLSMVTDLIFAEVPTLVVDSNRSFSVVALDQ